MVSISIHTTRVGGDRNEYDVGNIVEVISIHTTRVGGDHIIVDSQLELTIFQSTPPVWVVTIDRS